MPSLDVWERNERDLPHCVRLPDVLRSFCQLNSKGGIKVKRSIVLVLALAITAGAVASFANFRTHGVFLQATREGLAHEASRAVLKASQLAIVKHARECGRSYEIVADYWGRAPDHDRCLGRYAAASAYGLVDRLDKLVGESAIDEETVSVVSACVSDMLAWRSKDKRDVLTSKDLRAALSQPLLFTYDQEFFQLKECQAGFPCSGENQPFPAFGVEYCVLDLSGPRPKPSKHDYRGRFGSLPGLLAVLTGEATIAQVERVSGGSGGTGTGGGYLQQLL